MAGQTVVVSVLADTARFTAGMKRAGQDAAAPLERVRGAARNAAAALGGLAAGVGLAGLVGGLGGAVRAASDLEQTAGALDAVFGEQAGTMRAWAADAARSAGLSAEAYGRLATSIGTTLKGAGVPLEQLGGQTDQLLRLSGDLSAMFGGSVADAAAAMGSALRGEFEPLRAYGVSLSAATIEARALADSGKTSAAALTEQDRALATQALILERTTDAQGAFNREAGTFAGQTERLRAQVTNLAAGLGGLLLPALTGLVAGLSGALGDLEGVAAALYRWRVPLGIVAGLIATVFLPHLIALGVTATVQAARTLAAWALTQAGAVAAAAVHSLTVVRMVAGWVLMGVQSLIQAARMAAAWLIALGPVGWVIAAVVGLAALIIANWDKISAWTKQAWSAVTEWLTGAWRTITTGARAAWDGLLAWFRQIPGWFLDVFRRFTLAGLLLSHWDQISAGARAAWDGLIAWFRGVPGKLVGAFGNVGTMLRDVGGRLISGLLDGIRNGFESVRRLLGQLTDLLPEWKGPAGRDDRLLSDAGRRIIDGLTAGMRARYPRVRAALSDLTGMIGGTSMPALAGPTLSGTPTGSAAGRYARPAYSVTVNAVAPTADVGRAVVAAIRDYERVNGAGR